MTELDERRQPPGWDRGSVDFFRDEWIRWESSTEFIFPRRPARNQWDGFESLKAEAMLRLVRETVPAGGRVLEYGCGAAGILIFLGNAGYRGTALDATDHALRIARANDAAEGDLARRPPIGLVQADALRMPFGDATFDCVLSNGLLEHFAPEVVPVLLGEVVRVLKPGGLFLADIVHRRPSTRQLAKPLNFLPSYAKQVAGGRGLGGRALWRSLSTPMYENDFGRAEWRRALEAAGLEGATVRGFRLPPPLVLPARLDRWYGRLLQDLAPVRWLADPHPYHVPLGWVHLAWGRRRFPS